MPSQFRRIAIMGRHKNAETTETMQNLLDHLKQRDVSLLIEAEAAKPLKFCDIKTVDQQDIGGHADLIIVVGGDGSLLQAARTAVESNTPIVGVNRGRLGFLTDIKPKDLSVRVDALLDGAFFEEQRLLIEATYQGTTFCPALNDIVLATGDTAHMVEFEVYVDDSFMCSERSDGMIVATPTGSTAYALSGGGPILHPSISALALVPMFSHALSSRPIVVPGNSQIKMVIGEQIHSKPRLSVDGIHCCELESGDEIMITSKNRCLRLLHPGDYNYFANVRDKLHWGRKLGRTDQ